jgi:MoaA/NifB/PqqE/SkfB family radical SAM enzyme
MNPTVTISAGNYCQLRCPYCVSGSNTDEWKPRSDPPKHEVTDIVQTMKWIDRFRTSASIHVSGGEPLIRPDIVDFVSTILDFGYPDVTVFTNGLNVPGRARMLELPVKWCLTYHQACGLTAERWLRLVEPIKTRPHVLHTVCSNLDQMRRAHELRSVFSGWNYIEKWDRNPQHTMIRDYHPDPHDLEDIASNRLTLIVPNGSVYPCNCATGAPIGNVVDMSFDRESAVLLDLFARSCALRNACSAFQTADLFSRIPIP